MIEQLINGYASALNDVIRDSGFPAPNTVFSVHDIVLPEGTPLPSVDVAPEMEPIEIYADDNVRVRAILVDHQPNYPAYAFEFITPAGTIVISGDTAITDNLLKIAENADILVNEVISLDWLDSFIPEPRDDKSQALYEHIRASHTSVEEIGPIAEQLGVKNLVLYHFAPPTFTEQQWRDSVHGYTGNLVVGMPLTEVTLQ